MSIGADNDTWVVLASRDADRSVPVRVGPGTAPGWAHTGLVVATVTDEVPFELELDGQEAVVVPLSGGCDVRAGGLSFSLDGRTSVFAGPSDVAYVPAGQRISVTGSSRQPSRIAVCLAATGKSDTTYAARRMAAADVPIEDRGSGRCARQVRNFGVPGVLDADSIIACEVITPAGNWSSYPPHKHDEERPGIETELEEIYYFESQASAPAGESATDPVGYQRVYGTPDRPIDVLAEVRTGDVVLVPHGWHGPAMAAPDADLYYLNVMAGPGPERAWRICTDERHATAATDPPASSGGER